VEATPRLFCADGIINITNTNSISNIIKRIGIRILYIRDVFSFLFLDGEHVSLALDGDEYAIIPILQEHFLVNK